MQYRNNIVDHSILLTADGKVLLSTNRGNLEINFIHPTKLAGLKEGCVLAIYRLVGGQLVNLEFAHVTGDTIHGWPDSSAFKSWLQLPPDTVILSVQLEVMADQSGGESSRSDIYNADAVVDFIAKAVALSPDKLMMEMYPIKYVCNPKSKAIAKSITNQHVLINLPNTKLIVDVSMGDVGSAISQFALTELSTITPLIDGVPITYNGRPDVNYYLDLLKRGSDALHPEHGHFKEWLKHVTII